MPDPSIIRNQGTGIRNPESQLSRPTSAAERRVGSTQSTSLRDRMGRILNRKVLSYSYLGKDDQGLPMYRIQFTSIGAPAGRAASVRTVTFDGNQFGVPKVISRRQGSGLTDQRGPDSSRSGGPTAQSVELQRVKDKWLAWAVTNLEDAQLATAKSVINGWSRSPEELDNKMMLFSKSPGAGGLPEESQFGLDFGGGGGGGGGGFAGPEYVTPDKRVVEDMVGGLVTALVGTKDEGLVKMGTDLYMKDHRRNFDSPNQEIDPAQSVLEAIRESDSYQTIHQLRPDSEDERSWVSSRRQAAAQGGLAQGAQEDFAIDQATVGGDLPDVAEGAAMQQLNTSGSAQGTLLQDRLRQTATAMFSQVAV